MPNKAMLIILDGFGLSKDGPFNAVKNAKMPFYRELISKNPCAQLENSGEAVGLPEGVMGNSEVGHMTLGAGRIIFQDLTRISKAIRDKTFFQNGIIRKTILAGKEKTGRVHFMGLLSDAGVHSNQNHLLALLDLCVQLGVPNVSIHAFTDGRDTPPNSGINYMRQLLEHPTFTKDGKNGTKARIATIEGRYWAMDRDKRWERVARAYAAMTGQIEVFNGNPIEVFEQSYKAEKTDEFIDPVLLDKNAAIQDGDSVFFFNFRADRAREISEAITSPSFNAFERKIFVQLSAFAGLTQYDKHFSFPAAFPPQNIDNIFGEWLEKKGLSQFRTAETEKYAHVTFFFNGGRENPFKNEERLLISSPREVPTYDLKPEMSAPAVGAAVAEKAQKGKHDFILVNFANPDMVGHTGNYDAVVKALETLDGCLKSVIEASQQGGYEVLVTSDHGNAEEMRDENGQLHTQHTLNPVPITWISPPNSPFINKNRKLQHGGLSDIMPTLCDLMQIDVPKEVTGKSLIVK